MGAGKVDFKNLWKNEQDRQRRIRWRTLQMEATGALVSIYGYACQPEGPWFGYTLADLETAPCSHCGLTKVFRRESWAHQCPGVFDGKRLPCSEGLKWNEIGHLCRGEPSMSYGGVPFWRSTDWHEVQLASR